MYFLNCVCYKINTKICILMLFRGGSPDRVIGCIQGSMVLNRLSKPLLIEDILREYYLMSFYWTVPGDCIYLSPLRRPMLDEVSQPFPS